MYTTHLEEWVAECQRLNLGIRGKAAQGSIAALHGVRPQSQDQSRPQFSPQQFVNALVEFIVANDLVCFYLFTYYLIILKLFLAY